MGLVGSPGYDNYLIHHRMYGILELMVPYILAQHGLTDPINAKPNFFQARYKYSELHACFGHF